LVLTNQITPELSLEDNSEMPGNGSWESDAASPQSDKHDAMDGSGAGWQSSFDADPTVLS